MTESADTYLGGSLAGLAIEDALAQLETAQSMFLDEGYTVEQTTIGGLPAIVISGTNSVAVMPTGYAATVADGVVIEVTLDGANLASDAGGLGALAASVLELAVAAQAVGGPQRTRCSFHDIAESPHLQNFTRSVDTISPFRWT